MTRYEKRMFFERLVELRTAHAAAGDDDRRAVISIDDAIAEAERTFDALIAEDATTAVDQ